ncbi:MAG: riboflavin synthase [Candidatus Dormibacteria bacterium]
MFSGIVSERGRVESAPSAGTERLAISHRRGWSELRVGDSVAVNGCCLTVVEVGDGTMAVEVIPETLRRTTLGSLVQGDPVNLEAALQLRSAVGGHLVSGHVDATGEVLELRPEGNAVWLGLAVPTAVSRYCVPQGSIAIDGCSLTLVSVRDLEDRSAVVEVSLIPHTVAATIAGGYRTGSKVNLEADQVAKLVERLLAPFQMSAPAGAPTAVGKLG